MPGALLKSWPIVSSSKYGPSGGEDSMVTLLQAGGV